MKYYVLIALLIVAGCQQTPNKQMQVYYSSPAIEGFVFFGDHPIADAQIYLLTTCNDKQTLTDTSGYFKLTPSCMELIPKIAENQLGFFYQLIIVVNDQPLVWQIDGLGYGYKEINANIELKTKSVVYQINNNETPAFEKVDELTTLYEEK